MNDLIFWLYFVPACIEAISWAMFMTHTGVTGWKLLTAALFSLVPVFNLYCAVKFMYRITIGSSKT